MTAAIDGDGRPLSLVRDSTGVAGPHEDWVWDRRYAENPWPSEPDHDLVDLVSPLQPGKALDLGCGPGRNSIWLAQRGWDVTGVDASAVGLAQASERASDAGVSVRTVLADLLSYRPEAEEFDLVVVANIHLLEPERTLLFSTAAEALRAGGHLFVVGHHLDDLGRTGPPDPDRLYTTERLQDSFPTLVVHRLESSPRRAGPGEPPLTDVVVWAERPG